MTAPFSIFAQKLAFTTDSYVVRPLFFPEAISGPCRERDRERSGDVRRAPLY
jgi:hypothetical protein